MKFVVISDTHGQHEAVALPEADAIIHAGDVSSRGKRDEVERFLLWFAALNYKHKIFIAGNHDFLFEQLIDEDVRRMIPEGVIYLNDSGVTVEGCTIWGSPVTPWFYDWAFNRQRGAEIRKHWDLIPANTDILVTHGPAFGICDKTIYGDHVGCADLLQKIGEIKPRFHLSGHIHEAYGQQEQNGTRFINASVLDAKYRLKHAPVLFEL